MYLERPYGLRPPSHSPASQASIFIEAVASYPYLWVVQYLRLFDTGTEHIPHVPSGDLLGLTVLLYLAEQLLLQYFLGSPSDLAVNLLEHEGRLHSLITGGRFHRDLHNVPQNTCVDLFCLKSLLHCLHGIV